MATRPEMEGKNYWKELFAMRDEQRARQATAIQVVRGKDLPLERNEHGLMRWYLHPAIRDTILSTLMLFKQEIPPGSRSGRLKFQGGQVMYILEGRGYTVLDGVKHPWGRGRRAQPSAEARRHRGAALQRRSLGARRIPRLRAQLVRLHRGRPRLGVRADRGLA